MATDYEFLFKNVDLIDGTGGRRRQTDVAISRGRIVSIGDIPDEASEAVLDVSGKVLAPGFIDPHGHSDLTLLSQPTGLSKIMQGVTTEIIGNCGMAPAPVTELNRSELDGDGMFMRGGEDVDLSWESMGDYLARLGDGGLGFNVLPLVGHCQIRSGAMGFEDRAPTAPELQRMRDLLREALDAGALGMSTGLIFPPSSYADTEELVELAKVLADHGAMYFSHIRGEDHRLSAAVTEAVEIGERSGAPVQIAHFKAFGSRNWGSVGEGLQILEDAAERGVNIATDVYPYVAGMGSLSQSVPEWVQEGGVEAMLMRIKHLSTRRRIEEEMKARQWEWDRSIIAWMATRTEGDEIGQSVAEVAVKRGVAPETAALDLLLREGGGATIVCYGMDEADVKDALRHPASMVCSDALAVTPNHRLGTGLSHPRFYGTFPRVLGRYSREQGLFPMEEAVHRMTGKTAGRLGLRRKGIIEVGRDADVVIFNDREVIDRATFEHPHQYPVGIDHVMVAGTFVVKDGEPTNELPGKITERPRDIPIGPL